MQKAFLRFINTRCIFTRVSAAQIAMNSPAPLLAWRPNRLRVMAIVSLFPPC
jgi:hypothetical protein